MDSYMNVFAEDGQSLNQGRGIPVFLRQRDMAKPGGFPARAPQNLEKLQYMPSRNYKPIWRGMVAIGSR